MRYVLTLSRQFTPLLALCLMVFALPVKAADRDRIDAFLETTGFDVALDSIAFASASAPDMLGMEPNSFGSDWTRITEEVFDTEVMHGIAVDILSETLSDEALLHAVEFYAGDLGQRLVEVENASHMMEDDEAKQTEGRALVAEMVENGSDRLE
ncbi:DUF2059 domain-containing protein, partial [Cribrihabitans sp. XS_ASV171]